MTTITLYALVALYGLWLFYLASMALIRARNDGTITRTALVLGYPVVAVALALDFVLNMTLFTLIFVDPPREKLITARLRRYINGSGWRSRLARWFAHNLLDVFDPSGRHV